MKYRETLLNTARELLTESLEPGMGLLGVFEEPFRLVARLRWLEKKTWLKRGWMAAAAILVLAIAIPCILPMAQAEQTETGWSPGWSRPHQKQLTSGDASCTISDGRSVKSRLSLCCMDGSPRAVSFPSWSRWRGLRTRAG